MVRRKEIANFLDRHLALIFILPTLLILGAICVYPVLYSVWISFTNYHLLYGISKYFTINNYLDLFLDPVFWVSLWQNFYWLVGSTVFQVILGTTLALALDQPIRGKRIWETLIIVPWAFSTFAVVFTWRWMLDPIFGIVNYIFMWLHLIPLPISWLGNKSLVMPSLIQINVWFGTPFIVLTVLAGLQTIPDSDYEVARIEGASYPQILRYVIFPRIEKILAIIVILKSIWTFNNFDIIFLATGGGPMVVTQTVPIYAYIKAWPELFLGKGASMTTILLLLLIAMTIIYFRLFKMEE